MELNAEAGYAIGLSLEVSKIICVISDFKANILYSKHEEINVSDGKNAIIDQMIALIENVISHVGVNKNKILGVGLAVPGLCIIKKNYDNPPNLPGWINVPIKDIFKAIGIESLRKQKLHAPFCRLLVW